MQRSEITTFHIDEEDKTLLKGGEMSPLQQTENRLTCQTGGLGLTVKWLSTIYYLIENLKGTKLGKIYD